MIYVGIDWSDKFHSFCILDDAGNKVASFDIEHGQEGFESAHARIAKHCEGVKGAAVAIETKDSLLVDFLLELGYTLHFLNPKQTDRFRDRYRMSKAKSDPFDAYVLANSLRTDAILFNALSPLDEQSLLLRVLTRTREGLVNRKVAIQNELTAYLKRYFPVALELFGGLDNREAIGFLLQYPSYEQARTVSEARIISILKKQGVGDAVSRKHAAAATAKLKQPQPTPSSGVQRAYPLAVKSLLRQLQDVLAEVKALDEEIRDRYLDHPNRNLIESLPGIAETLGPVLAAEFGTDMVRFSSLRTLRAFAGTSPVTVRSGRYKATYFRRACNQHIRRALHLASQSAIITCSWARELYDRLRAKGCSYGRALRAVADQLVEILYVVLLRQTPYNEAYHLQMKQVHGKR